MIRIQWLQIIMLSIMIVGSVGAQDVEVTAEPGLSVTPEHVLTQAEDGLNLYGDFYRVSGERPTVMLLHQLYTTRASWQPLLQPLLDEGYNVLVVDLRGFGETRASINWFKALDDVQSWLDWLREESGLQNRDVSLLGSSMGSTLAIRGCANEPACRSVIALSPGWQYYRIPVEEAFTTELIERPALLIYSTNDRWPALGVPDILKVATNPVALIEYPGNVHGIDLFNSQPEDLIPSILDWLREHNQ